MDVRQSIQATKNGFEASFQEEKFYNRQTQDEAHLKLLLSKIKAGKGQRVLDLGTGSGYLAFAIAAKKRESKVVGLDIVEKTLEADRERARKEGRKNLLFVAYDGVKFPFANDTFDYVTARYCLHHFPNIEATFREISRVLKQGGTFLLSDPTPNEDDSERFVDAYMQMKKDGHIRFYRQYELIDFAMKAGLYYEDNHMTTITFPKKKKDASEFDQLLQRYDKKVIDGYQIQVQEDEIYITEQVLNLTFRK